MGRRGFLGTLVADMERTEKRRRQESARAQRATVRAQRETERAHRAFLKERAAYDREAKRQYAEDRLAEATELNEELNSRVEALGAILSEGLERNAVVDFDSLKQSEEYPPFVDPPDRPGPAPDKSAYDVQGPTGLARLIPGAKSKHEKAVAEAEQRYSQAVAAHAYQARTYQAALAKAHSEYAASRNAHLEKVQAKNAEIDSFGATYRQGEPEAVVAYNTLVLDESPYSEGFPQEFRVAYVPESKELVCEYELPPPSVIPEVGEHRYVKARDQIEEKPRKAAA